MKLSFKWKIRRNKKENIEILKDIEWHIKKVSNMLLYEIKEGTEKIEENDNLNIKSSKIYKRYREENWHSKYLHSHTLQQGIIEVLSSCKSYEKLRKIYEEDKNKLKGKPRFPRYKKEKIEQEIVYSKYGIRVEKNELKLSISKKMQEKYKVKSINFLIPRKLRKLVDFSRIKLIKIKVRKEEIEMNIVYEKEEKKVEEKI